MSNSTTRYVNRPSAEGCGLWTAAEHQRFLDALDVYPHGPWKQVAEFVGTRNVRQTMTHAQKYKQKQVRHKRGLRTRRQPLVLPQESNANAATPSPRDAFSASAGAASSEGSRSGPLSSSFMDLLQQQQEQDADDQVASLAPPLTIYDACYSSLYEPYAYTSTATYTPTANANDSALHDHFVLATPVVSDCLDYLVRSFA